MQLDSNADGRAKVVAFNLPQFHPIPENDEWWGEGFTEWTNVRRATPQFPGHIQPAEPGELGYYNLTDPETQAAQQRLAKRYGVGAFCHYVYWFGGKRLLERPLEVIRDHPELDLPYCFCWANENWTRTWDGHERNVLQPQNHDPVADARIVEDLAEHLADPRYLRVKDKPLFIIYRSALLNEPARTVESIRKRAAELGLGELHLAAVQSAGFWDPRPDGFDSAIEFPPHPFSKLERLEATHPLQVAVQSRADWAGQLRSYPAAIEFAMTKPVPEFRWFRGVMPAWDNIARRGTRGWAYVDSSPEAFQSWLERALHYTYLYNPPGERLVFVNAWNEWGEGAYLEPDRAHGLARLEALQQALSVTEHIAADDTSGGFGELARLYFGAFADLGREAFAAWRAQ